MEDSKDILLQQIANHLILNSSSLTDLGLFHGKMGVVLFFFHYANYTNNIYYQEYAGVLLDEIFEDIHAGITLDFENGLSGIGWSLLYLLKNHFVEGDPDEVLADIDQKMIAVNLMRVSEFSLERGLEGFLCYLQERLSIKSECSLFDVEYVKDFQKAISSSLLKRGFDLSYLIKQNTITSIANLPKDLLGICDGYAGYGFKLMYYG